MILSHSQAQAFYDRFGNKQDAQAFYEVAALDDLIRHGGFEQAKNVFELGCGTGRLALQLLTTCLPPSASYLGIDLSQTMVDIATQRLSPFMDRAKVQKSNGSLLFPLADNSVDRVVSAYVFDLLSEEDIRQAIREAHRVLAPKGRLCVVSLAEGVTLPSRIVSTLWAALFHLNASLIGGCRPIRLDPFFDGLEWSLDYRNINIQFGIPSEVLIASRR
jgi:ubiquinone/menaquinone biosynthesis C-methylase UbiE